MIGLGSDKNPQVKYFCQEKLAQMHLVDFPSVGNKITAFCGRLQLISNGRRKNRDQPTSSITGYSVCEIELGFQLEIKTSLKS